MIVGLYPYTESIFVSSTFRFHIGIIMDCLHSIGAIPYFQTSLHTLHSSSTPASPAAFITSMLNPSNQGAVPVFADSNDSSTSDRSIYSMFVCCLM